MSDDKAREFGIYIKLGQPVDIYEMTPKAPFDSFGGKYVHAIEHSAYEEKCAELKQVRELYGETIDELEAKLAVAVEALESLDCECSSSTGELLSKGPDCICIRCRALSKPKGGGEYNHKSLPRLILGMQDHILKKIKGASDE